MGSRVPDAPCIGGRGDSGRETHWGNFDCGYDVAVAQTEDNNGNTLSETTASPAAVTSYLWDRDNRLRLVTPPSPGSPTSYAYDTNGLRIQRVDSTGNVNYLLDGRSVLEELDGVLATDSLPEQPAGHRRHHTYQRAGVTEYPLTDASGRFTPRPIRAELWCTATTSTSTGCGLTSAAARRLRRVHGQVARCERSSRASSAAARPSSVDGSRQIRLPRRRTRIATGTSRQGPRRLQIRMGRRSTSKVTSPEETLEGQLASTELQLVQFDISPAKKTSVSQPSSRASCTSGASLSGLRR